MRVERGLQHPQFSKSPAALGLSLQRLPAMPILRVDCALLDGLRPSGTMIAANSHTERGWVEALGTPGLALCRAAPGLT